MRKRFKLASLAAVVASLSFSGAFGDEKLKTTTDQLPKTTVKFDMVQLPAGKVTLKDGKEYDIKPIWISTTEVTWDLYDVYWVRLDVPEAHRNDKDVAASRPSAPGSIHFFEADRFTKWLSAKTGHKYRLPTEAEWTYACRAGGNGQVAKAKLKDVAWYVDNGDDKTHEVAKMKPNAWGLFDTLGNVAEWAVRPDGTGVACGGSFQDEAQDVNSDNHAEYTRGWQRKDPQDPKGHSWLSDGPHIGFRIVRED